MSMTSLPVNCKITSVAALSLGIVIVLREHAFLSTLARALSPEYRGVFLSKLLGNVLEMGLITIILLGIAFWWNEQGQPIENEGDGE